MGGVAKGLLRAPSGETLLARWQRLFAELGVPCVLVGRHEAYRAAELESIADDPPGVGPLGGLIALLARAGTGSVVAVACDMPFVSRELLAKLLEFPAGAPVVAPRSGGRWEPLFARYAASHALPIAQRRAAAGRHSLQGLIDELGAEVLPLDANEIAELRDWDRPEDQSK